MLERTPGAFGPSTLALIESAKRRLVALSIDGLSPSLANLENGQWEWQKSLIMIMPENRSPQAQRFVDFVQSTEGRRIMDTADHGKP